MCDIAINAAIFITIQIYITLHTTYTVAHKRNAKPNFLTLKTHNSLTTNARAINLYSF